MLLRTISASSLTTFSECPRRFKAENIDRVPRTGGPGPAGVGTACHEALEKYVRAVYMEKTRGEDFAYLAGLYKVAFIREFNTADLTVPEFQDGMDMLENWYGRTDLSNTEIISVEVKDHMIINTIDGPRKYNYIWDRCDRLYEGNKKIIRVVDYKSIRAYLTPEDLREKIQARMYAMAAATQFKDENPDEIWVQFDLLRYGTVEVKFSRDDNLKTWKYVRDTANLILEMPDEKIPETLGPGCMFCVRKTTCGSLRKNVNGGGLLSLADSDEDLAKARLELEGVQKAAKYALDEIDNLMVTKAKASGELETETDSYKIALTSRRTRIVDDQEVAMILGPELTAQLGKISITAIDKLVKGNEISAAKKSQLQGAISYRQSELRPKITKKV